MLPRLLNRFAGTRFKIISGYKGTGDGMLAMERGEVEGIVGHELSALRAAKPDWLRDNKARIVIQVGLTKSPDLPDVPNALDLVRDEEARKVFGLLLTRQVTAGRSWRRQGHRPTSSRTCGRLLRRWRRIRRSCRTPPR